MWSKQRVPSNECDKVLEPGIDILPLHPGLALLGIEPNKPSHRCGSVAEERGFPFQNQEQSRVLVQITWKFVKYTRIRGLKSLKESPKS